MENDKLMSVEVAYAAPNRQLIIPLEVKEGCNMLEAVILSGIIDKFPEIDPGSMTLGIFSKVEKKPESVVLSAGDRVEIYRPLIADPKEARKKRAEKLKAKLAG